MNILTYRFLFIIVTNKFVIYDENCFNISQYIIVIYIFILNNVQNND